MAAIAPSPAQRMGTEKSDEKKKKLVAEFHFVPGLVGSIGKGFSSTSPSSATSSYPQPSVLPFPVAGCRSHGPHRSPLTSRMVKATGNDIEEYNGSMDYSQVYVYRLGTRRNESMDFSNWKEPVAGGDSANARRKKIVVKKTGGGGVESYRSVSNGGKLDTLQSSVHFVSEEETPVALNPKAFNEASIVNERIQVVKIQVVKNIYVEEATCVSLGSTGILNGNDINAKSKPVVDDTGMLEPAGPPSLMDDIDSKNFARLKQMRLRMHWPKYGRRWILPR